MPLTMAGIGETNTISRIGGNEGCLSLTGVRKCTRYQEIEVEYQDMNFKKQRQKYTGWTAQIIQHEIDHCQGIVI